MKSLLDNVRPVRVGIIGCGNIFSAYAKGCQLFRILELKACADLNPDTAQARADEFGIKALTIPELLADPEIDVVINLTIPQAHAQVTLDILRAGKHAYSEKPLGVTLEEARAIIAEADQRGLRVGCAPDTFLGAGYQSVRKLIDDGLIGRPLAGTAFMLSSGPESWHPNPGFLYQRGAGPLMDMGPYYVTALIHLLGPVKSVCAINGKAREERLATCKEQFGRFLPAEVPTHYAGTLLFESGAVVSLVVSFDVVGGKHNPIEIYGTDGSVVAPDPNTFGGEVELLRKNFADWVKMPLTFDYQENSRSIGVADMAHAIQSGRPHRCDARLALHSLEVISAFEASFTERRFVDLVNQCAQPAPFPLGMTNSLLDA